MNADVGPDYGRGGKDDFDKEIAKVLAGDNCSGCGACALINPNYSMQLSNEGYNRPHKAGRVQLSVKDITERKADLRASCPGLKVSAPRSVGAPRNIALGAVISSWEAWSNNDDLRFRGSSGGTLSALSAWLLESGRAARVVGAQSDPNSPSKTQSVVIKSAGSARSLAGSRYAPVSNAAERESLLPDTTFVGKPCEVSALRQLATHRGLQAPILMSFFCAGVPSQKSTEHLIDMLGIKPGTPLKTMRYRGNGWPGEFFAEDVEGNSVSTSYDESWGKFLGPTMQWRCKICPDGVGESADIVAGDFWRTDEKGYPSFENEQGISALLARTPRGHQLIVEAIAAGIISAKPLDVQRIAAIQPLQVSRRRTLFGRLAGRALAGNTVPTYVGFRLFRQAISNPIDSLRFAYGSFRRSLLRGRRSAVVSAAKR